MSHIHWVDRGTGTPKVLLFIIKSIKRDLKTRPIYLKIETRLIDEKFTSMMGECVI
jgi:hypothetical protein